MKKIRKEIESLDLGKWGNKHVLAWVKQIGMGDVDTDILEEGVKSNKLTGNDLEGMGMGEIGSNFSELSDFSKKKLLVNLNKIKKTRIFKKETKSWTSIFSKISRSAQGSESLSELESAADLLSNHERFYDRYFSFFVDFFKYDDLKDDEDADTERKELQVSIDERYKTLTGKLFFEGREPAVKLAHYCSRNDDRSWKIPCKIVITDIYGEDAKKMKNMRKVLSPMMTFVPKLKKNAKFGMFHAAVVVGPWYLEWNTSELIIPKKCFGSTKALISHDVPHGYTQSKDIVSVVNKLVEVLYKWNTEFVYARSTGDGKGNCQHFVDDVLKSLGIEQDVFSQGHLGTFLKNLRNKGQADLDFAPSKGFMKEFDLDDKRTTFKTHVELDTFVKSLIDKQKDGFGEGPKDKWRGEYLLLKSFDRAFWLRHYRFPDLEQYKPLMPKKGDADDEEFGFDDDDFDDDDFDDLTGISEETEVDCPFNNPKVTGSYIN